MVGNREGINLWIVCLGASLQAEKQREFIFSPRAGIKSGMATKLTTKRKRNSLPPPYSFSPTDKDKHEAKALMRFEAIERMRVERLSQPPLARISLPIDVKRRIVELFATFHSTKQVLSIVKRDYGLELSYVQVGLYNGSSSQFKAGKALRRLFDETRKAYLAGAERVGISHQSHRLRLIEGLIEEARESKEYGVALKGLEQAAREMGGQLTNVATVRHQGRIELSLEDQKAELAMRLGAVLDGGVLTPQLVDNTGDNGAS